MRRATVAPDAAKPFSHPYSKLHERGERVQPECFLERLTDLHDRLHRLDRMIVASGIPEMGAIAALHKSGQTIRFRHFIHERNEAAERHLSLLPG